MPPARRRVSYIIPPPTDPVPRLQLPPHGASKTGSSAPLLIPFRPHHAAADSAHLEHDAQWPRRSTHPRHRLGVCALALDTATQLVGRPSPEGILYTGGRDGLVIAWDLSISMRKRERRYGFTDDDMHRRVGRWEIMTGWADDVLEDDDAEDEVRSDGDILGDVQEAGTRRGQRRPSSEIPWEEQWETDVEAFQPGQASTFRLSCQSRYNILGSHPNSVSLYSRTQTGSTTSYSAITTRPLFQPRRMVLLKHGPRTRT
jgi:WD repeat-containing protein 48